MLDLYCERVAAGLVGEPLNTLSNAGFLFAAYSLRQRYGARVRLLAALLAAIGLGSTLFHALANRAAELGDVIPILLFQLSFLGLYLRRILDLRVAVIARWLVLFAAGLVVAAQFPDRLNGSLAYLPAAAALGLLGWLHQRRTDATRWWLLAACGLFLLSLSARTLDLALCPQWPWGTHCVWHLLNAVVLYAVVAAYASRLRLTSGAGA